MNCLHSSEAKQTRATRLDLGNCGLTELPDELFELTWLEELILSSAWEEYSIEEKKPEQFTSQNEGEANCIKLINAKIKILRWSYEEVQETLKVSRN